MKRFLVVLMALLAAPIASAAEGEALLLNETGSALSELQLSLVPGSSNSTLFRIAASGGNISSLALFHLGGFNVTIAPANITGLADGDSALFNVTVSVGNETSAGVKTEKILILTSRPEQLELPLVVDVLETGSWFVTSSQNVTRNTSVGEASLLDEVRLENRGNVDAHLRVSLLDPDDLVWIDETNFTLFPGQAVARPVYFSIRNGTPPGRYLVNLTFFDLLNNSRRVNYTLTVPDVTRPSLDVQLSSANLTPSQRLGVTALVTDDAEVDRVWGRIGTGGLFNFTRENEAWRYDAESFSIGLFSLAVFANDTSGNLAVQQLNFSVSAFNYLSSEASLDFLRFRNGEQRNLVLLNSIQQAAVNITLARLTPNQSVGVLIQGEELALGQTKQLAFSGDLLLSVVGRNESEFSGELLLNTTSDLINPSPRIAFRGAVGNYSVTPASQFVVANLSYDCRPNDAGTYERSSYACVVSYPVDVNVTALTFTVPKASYDALIQGFQAESSQLRRDLDSSRSVNWIMLFIVIIVVSAYLLWRFVLQNVHLKMG